MLSLTVLWIDWDKKDGSSTVHDINLSCSYQGACLDCDAQDTSLASHTLAGDG